MNAASKKSRLFLFSVMAVGAAVVGVFLFSFQRAAAPAALPDTNMTITSPAFSHNGSIPKKFTCDGENINPELQISGVPAGAKSLALIMDDPDIPDFVKQKMRISVFDHWIVFNIPQDTKTIGEGTEPSGIAGLNSTGTTGYIGPCPPDREHRYFFKLYALDAMLDLKTGASRNEVEGEINKYLLDKAELIGIYER